jgi:hypothetical protein
LILIALLIMVCCKKDKNLKPDLVAGAGTFIDYGSIPEKVFASYYFQTAFYFNETIYIGTTNGIWKNDLKTRTWSRSGLVGRKITCVYQHPVYADTFFAGVESDNTATAKTLYISNDRGLSWSAAKSPVYDNLENRFENYVCIAVRPGEPDHIYANLENGAMIAVSKDRGQTWVRMNYYPESYIGDACCIAFLPGDGNRIFQGAEAPLDDAWLATYDIDNQDPAILKNLTKIVDMKTWSNRRPNQICAFSYLPNNLYVGLEGALSKVNGNKNQFIFKSDNGENFPYSYIKGLWVDPEDSKHLLFGGATKLPMNDLRLFETCDEGLTIYHFTDPLLMEDPGVLEILNTNTYPAIIVSDPSNMEIRLLLYRNE